MAAYQEAYPLAAGWRERMPLHQLHPLLVHAALFAGGYGRQAASAATALCWSALRSTAASFEPGSIEPDRGDHGTGPARHPSRTGRPPAALPRPPAAAPA